MPEIYGELPPLLFSPAPANPLTKKIRILGCLVGWQRLAASVKLSTPEDLQAMLYPESLVILKESLDTQSARIAVVDSEATIVIVNAAWCTYSEKNGVVSPYVVGSNYLKELEGQSGTCPLDSEGRYVLATIHQGLHDILAGKQDVFEREYACIPPGQPPSKAERYRVLIRPVQLFDFFGAQLRHERVLDPHNETVRP